VIQAEKATYTVKRMCDLLECHGRGSTNGGCVATAAPSQAFGGV
jgi:hypothetical protein